MYDTRTDAHAVSSARWHELNPVGVKGQISPESWTRRTLGTGPSCTNTVTLIIQPTMFALQPPRFPPFFIKRFAVRGWEKVFGCMYVFVSPPLGLPEPLWADLIDSGLGGGWGCLSPSLKLFNGRVHFRLSPTVLIPYSSSVKVLRAQKCIYFYLITTNIICHCVKNRFSSIKMGQDANLLFPSWECK